MNFYDENENYSQDDIVKLILEYNIDLFSKDEFTKDLVTLLWKEREEGIELKDKAYLSSFDILVVISKTYGTTQLLKAVSAMLDLDIKKNKKRKKPKRKVKKEKFIKASPNIEPKKDKDKYKGNEANEYTYYAQGSNPINLAKDKTKTIDDLIIEIDNNNKNNTDYNNHVISLVESDSSNSGKNDSNCGAKSEIKSPKQIINLGKKNEKRNVKQNKGLKTECKIFKTVKKPFQEKLLLPKDYHYIIRYGHLFKYKFDDINADNNTAKYKCVEPKCKSIGIYNLISGIFDVKIWHSIPYIEHCYVKDFSEKDAQVLECMKINNALDLQTD